MDVKLQAKALVPVYHTGQNQYLQPGDVADFSHLEPEVLAKLVRQKVLAPLGPTLEDLPGIGPEWVKALRTLGIQTVVQLAVVEPVWLESKLGGISLAQARRWVEAARRVLEGDGDENRRESSARGSTRKSRATASE